MMKLRDFSQFYECSYKEHDNLWNVFIWSGIEINGELVDTVMNLGFQKILGIYLLAEQLLGSLRTLL